MFPDPLESYPRHEGRSIFDLIRKHKHTGTIATVTELKRAPESINRQLLRRVGACREYLSPTTNWKGRVTTIPISLCALAATLSPNNNVTATIIRV